MPQLVERQSNLDEFEQKQVEELIRFEADKGMENDMLREELDRAVSQYMARMQANEEQVTERREVLAAWRRWKQRESRRLAGEEAWLSVS